MLLRTLTVAAAMAFVFTACTSSKDDDASSTSTGPDTTAVVGTTAVTEGTTQTTPGAPGSTSTTGTSESVPPVTPPAGQPAACSLLSESTLTAVGVPPGTTGVAADQPDGFPAPSTGCRWESDQGILVLVYYGRDPLEILAVARQVSPGGNDVTGLGQDAYFVPGVLFVDTGGDAFAVNGAVPQDQLETLARDVIGNL